MRRSISVHGRLLVVTPLWNERQHIDRLAESMVRQTRTPDEWIVVDDGSTDGTGERVRELRAQVPFMSVVNRRPPAVVPKDRLAAGRPPQAFNAGIAAARHRDWEIVAKVDGDTELPSDYFERLLGLFRSDRQLGMASGQLLEPYGGGWRRVGAPPHHVAGPLKAYRRECLSAIGGVPEQLGWDTVDEMRARMHGYSTRSYQDLLVKHHRPTGGVLGVVRGRARHGTCAWIAHYPLGFVVLRSAKLAVEPPRGVLGLSFIYGYVRAALMRSPRVEDPAFARHVRAELRARVQAVLPQSHRSATAARRASP